MTDHGNSVRDAIAAGHSRYPVVREMILDADTAVTAFRKIHRGGHGFLLESLEGGERWARYSFMATEPAAVFRYRNGRIERLTDRDSWQQHSAASSPLDHLGELMRTTTAPRIEGLPRFTGGAVGFWGYDVVRDIEHLPSPPPDDRELPDAVTMVVDTLLVIDHLFHRAIVIANAHIASGMSDDDLHSALRSAGSRADEWIDRLHASSSMTRLSLSMPAEPISCTSGYAEDRFRADV